ncbi:MAG TPA: AMP-binding protein, partial [Solirubrobacterales bacterium]|nr:AMP-binding protein [Solirubrobacterales bacterium]
GRPKGALLTHRGLRNLAEAQRQVFAVRPGTRLLQFASLSFDASIFEIVMALRAGAALHLATKDELAPGEPLLKLLREQAIAMATLPPTVLATLTPEELPELQTLVVAGEACTAELVERWSPGRRFFNAYGPTEATVWSTTALCRGGERITIGRPIANTRAYVLDAHLRPVPVGVAGELYLGGDGLARGYLNRPALTAERFIPDPFSQEPGGRLYRTGDVARYLADGRLDFLGRADHQVKLRGFRVELGEIETLLSQHPAVCDAVVLADDSASAGKRLVAYAAVRDEGITAGELREYLKGQLPDYMVPSALVLLGELPLTPSGKVDRKALPAPDFSPASDASAYEPPRTPMQELLAGVWAELLGVERVGLGDNFFDLGGHSLLATRALSRIREVLGVELPLRSIFEAPTLEALAERIEEASREGEAQGQPPLVRADRSRPLPLSFAQQGLWFLDQLEPGNPFYNCPGAVRLEGQLDAAALERALNEVVRRHEALRTGFAATDGRPRQVIADEAKLPLVVEDLRALHGREAEAR